MSQAMRLYVSQQVKARVKLAEESLYTMTSKYKKEMTERKKLHNLIQELKGNIRVYMRCRPPSAKEMEIEVRGSFTIIILLLLL